MGPKILENKNTNEIAERLFWAAFVGIMVGVTKEFVAHFYALSFFGEYWIFFDLLTRIITIFLILFYIRMKFFRSLFHALTLKDVYIAVSLIISGNVFRDFLRLYLDPLDYHFIPPNFPDISTIWLQFFDLAIVLPFVAIAEELLYRAVMILLFVRFFSGPVAVLVAALFFAAIHLDQGIVSALINFVFGCLYGSLFLVTKRLGPLGVAHYLQNLWINAGIYFGYNTRVFMPFFM